jgi:hypothetical protein
MKRVMYKFGFTKNPDAIKRYTVSHAKYGFNKKNLADDFDVDCRWSAWVTKERAQQMEAEWAVKFPSNIDTVSEGLAKYNGITECRFFTNEQWDAVRKSYYGCKEKKESAYKKSGDYKVYIMEFTEKELVV